MPILPSIFGFLLFLTMTMPLVANMNGFGISSTPSLVSRQNTTCTIAQKDSYGRCPFTGSSNFRYISTGSGTSGGGSRSGGGSGGK